MRGVRIQRRGDHQSDLRVRIRRVFGWGIRANHAIFNRLVQEEEAVGCVPDITAGTVNKEIAVGTLRGAPG